MPTFAFGPRRARLLVPAVLALIALTGCSASSTSSDDATASTGSAAWTYTDDTGTTVTLDAQPTRIASYSDYAVGLLAYGVSPVAIFGRMDVATDSRFDPYDISGAAIVGNSYGEIDLEALAAAEPDLIVTGIYPSDRDGTLDLESPYYALADLEQQEQLEAIAPIVAIEIGGDGADVITSFNSLAAALGADEDTIDAARSTYDEAAANLSAAAAAAPGIEVTQMYADSSGVYVVKPADEPETALYTSLGVTYTELNPDGDYYWDIYSWENAAQMMTGDVLLVNEEGYQSADLAAQPTFAGSAALQAGQVYGWQVASFDYVSQAEQMDKLTQILTAAQDVA